MTAKLLTLWTMLRKARAAGVPCPLCESEERRAA
jgi:hypothetical protein